MPNFIPGLRSAAVILFASMLLAPRAAMAQHDDDHDHNDGPLHFSHPLFTESPSPDTKLRFDYLRASIAPKLTQNTFRVEGEYAFTHNVSLEANLPFTSESSDGVRTNAVGSGEIALKLASFAQAEHGILLGGGLAFGIPTGSDHVSEMAPYVDLGYMHESLEFVSFASYNATLHRTGTDEKERSVSVAGSLLYHVASHLESLVEIEARRSVAGAESGTQIVNGGVGIKLHIPQNHALVVGAGARVPLTNNKEFRSGIILSALYHF